MNTEIKVSIITICKDSILSIEQAITSVLNQTYTNIEYIIIDGKSTDGTLNIINKYKNKIKMLISEPDKGISDAFNKGVSYATGELVGFLNSDDTYEPNSIEVLVAGYLSIAKRADIVYGDCLCHFSETQKYIVHANSPENFDLKTPFLCHQAVLAKRTLFEEIGFFDIKLKYGMDYDWFLRCLNMGKIFHYIGKFILVNYSQNGFSANNNNKALFEFYKIATKHISGKTRLSFYFLIKITKNYLQNVLIYLGLRHLVVYLKSKFYKKYTWQNNNTNSK